MGLCQARVTQVLWLMEVRTECYQVIDDILKYLIILLNKIFVSLSSFTEVFFKIFNWREVIVGLGMGLVPNRQQAILPGPVMV